MTSAASKFLFTDELKSISCQVWKALRLVSMFPGCREAWEIMFPSEAVDAMVINLEDGDVDMGGEGMADAAGAAVRRVGGVGSVGGQVGGAGGGAAGAGEERSHQ